MDFGNDLPDEDRTMKIITILIDYEKVHLPNSISDSWSGNWEQSF